MAIIQHNLTAMNANRQLGISTGDKAKVSEKLSSGYRINRSADDAAGLTISEKMRWQIRGLDKASNNIQDGKSLTNVADGALNEVHGILQRQRELLVQAANDTNTTADRQAIQNELDELSKECDRIYNDTEFNTIKIFKGKDTILDGPNQTQNVSGPPDIVSTGIEIQTEIFWLDKPSTTPPNTTDSPGVTNTIKESISQYKETETVHEKFPNGHDTYDFNQIEIEDIREVTETKVTDVSYAPATNSNNKLMDPGNAVEDNGFFLVKPVSTVTNSTELSCVLTELDIKVDGNEKLDLYDDSTISKATTRTPGDVSTSFDLGDGLTLTQKITYNPPAMDTYSIQFLVSNTGALDRKLSLKMAFDTANSSETTQAVDNNTTGNTFVLKNEDKTAEIKVSASNTTKEVYGLIDKIYNRWDEAVTDQEDVGNHTGVGYWWEGADGNGVEIPAGTSDLEIGTVKYGPFALLKDPYEMTTKVETTTTEHIEHKETITTTTFLPEYMDIQAGALSNQNIPIRLWDLSNANLRLESGNQLSAFTADKSLPHMDRVIEKISSIRSYYGALSNRFEHAQSVDDNTSENTQAAESRIRDADIAKCMVAFSSYNILQQAGQAMLAQTMQQPQRVVELLTE